MAASAQQQLLPNFVSPFKSQSPFFYFHHVINPEEATLEVQVIGPNLRFTFQHSRAIALMPPSVRRHMLEQKTVGFLAMVRGTDRHIVAWAESGHGAGRMKDLLDAPPGSPVLPNRIWTRRVVQLGTLLGFKMGSFFDKMGSRGATTAEDHRGIFRGSHVEVKLAAFAVCLMLESFGITKDLDNVKRRNLRQLRNVSWEDGTRPSFEIYFSRKNCLRCGFLVKALADMTGIPITLSWKDRLTPKIYETIPIRPNKRQKRAITVEDNVIADLQKVITIEDEDSDGPETGSQDFAIVIDEDAEMMDLTTAGPERITEADGMGEFINRMLEYTRKVDSSPDNPVVTRIRRHIRTLAPREEGPINKPLPATPVDESPDVNVAGVPRPRKSPNTPCASARARSTSPSQAEPQQPVVGVRERSPRRYRSRSEKDKTTTSPTTGDPREKDRGRTQDAENPEPVAGVRERSPRPYQSKKSPSATPDKPGEKDQDREPDFVPKASPDETPSKTPVREEKRSPSFVVKIPMRSRSRSPSPFDF